MQEKIFKISGFTAKAMYRLEAEVDHRGDCSNAIWLLERSVIRRAS
jgi:hypothetical protein